MIGGGAVHVRGLELHLAGGDGCVKLDLSPVHDVEHQADADDNLRRTGEEASQGYCRTFSQRMHHQHQLTCRVNTK